MRTSVSALLLLVWMEACGGQIPAPGPGPGDDPRAIREADVEAVVAELAPCDGDENPAVTAAYGDLTGDGVEEAAVVVRCTGSESPGASVHVLRSAAGRVEPLILGVVRAELADAILRAHLEDGALLVESTVPLFPEEEESRFVDVARFRWDGAALAAAPIERPVRIEALMQGAELARIDPAACSIREEASASIVLCERSEEEGDGDVVAPIAGFLVTPEGTIALGWLALRQIGVDEDVRWTPAELRIEGDLRRRIAALHDDDRVVALVRATAEAGPSAAAAPGCPERPRVGAESLCGPIARCRRLAAVEVGGRLVTESPCLEALREIEVAASDGVIATRESVRAALSPFRAESAGAASCRAPSAREVAAVRARLRPILEAHAAGAGDATPEEHRRRAAQALASARVGCPAPPTRAFLITVSPAWGDASFSGALYRAARGEPAELQRFSWDYVPAEPIELDLTGDGAPELVIAWGRQDSTECGHHVFSPAWDAPVSYDGLCGDAVESENAGLDLLVWPGGAGLYLGDELRAWDGEAFSPVATEGLPFGSVLRPLAEARRTWEALVRTLMSEPSSGSCESWTGEVARLLVELGTDRADARELAAAAATAPGARCEAR